MCATILKLDLSPNFTDELKQKQAISERLINKILYSKRLLVDHVEALEQCLPQFRLENISAAEANKSIQNYREIFTVRNTCLLVGTTAIEHLLTPKSLRLTLIPSLLLSVGFSAVFVVKNIFVCRNKIVERELDNLIRNIDEFGNCMRRNMTYFNEIAVLKQQEFIDSRQVEYAWDCITAAKEVTEILYDATRKLETLYPLPQKFAQFYSPMEELRESEYFKNNVTDYNPKQIKDFHNIFAYVQSQFLLRLALTISTKPSLSQLNVELLKIDCLIRQLVQEEEMHFKNLAIELNKKKQMEIDKINAAKAMQNRSGPIAVLQDSSLKLSARMVAVAAECQALDITLQRLNIVEVERKDSTDKLMLVVDNMRNIEDALSVCFEDFQNLVLVYNKFLSCKLEAQGKNSMSKAESPETDEEFPESFLRVEISQNHNDAEKSDDFYAYLFDENQAKLEQEQQTTQSPTHEMEILNFEKRTTKGKFRPVLKQLKERIDPIRQDMLEKERKVLAAKGINVDKFFSAKSAAEEQTAVEKMYNSDLNDSSDSDEGSADLEFEKRSKQLKERDNFAEMRNFLAQKQAINIFEVDKPPIMAAGDEEILESEC